MAFEIKRNDLRPHYRIQLTETDPSNTASMRPVNLTGATNAYFIMKGSSGPAKINRVAMTFIDRPTGIVEYVWTGTDTDTIGSFNVEIEINWSGEPQTFPSSGYFVVTINDDLG